LCQHRQRGIVGPRDGRDDRQAEAEAAAVQPGRPVKPAERLKQRLHAGGRHHRPAILHAQHGAARWLNAGLDRHPATGLVVPQRVVHQVRYQTLRQPRVTRRGSGPQRRVDPDPPRAGQLSASRDHRAGQRGEVEWLQLVDASFAAGQREQRVDEAFLLLAEEEHLRAGRAERLGAGVRVGDPPVLILDEPINGLDPEGIIWARNFLRTLAAQGRAVLVSSHLMSELQTLLTEGGADHLVIVGQGRVIADTSVAALLATAAADRVLLRTSAAAQAATVLTRAGATAVPTGPGLLMINGLSSERTVVLLTQHRIPFAEVTPHRASLEEAYLELTRESVEFRGQS
jgi:hypothetical protein